jgi:hypothetical protein
MHCWICFRNVIRRIASTSTSGRVSTGFRFNNIQEVAFRQHVPLEMPVAKTSLRFYLVSFSYYWEHEVFRDFVTPPVARISLSANISYGGFEIRN